METLTLVQEVSFVYDDEYFSDFLKIDYTSNIAVTHSKSDIEAISLYLKSECPNRDIKSITKHKGEVILLADPDFVFYDVMYKDEDYDELCHRYYHIEQIKMLQ